MPAHGARRFEERSQVRPVRVIDGRGSRHDVEIRLAELCCVAGEAHVGLGEIGRVDRMRTVRAPAEFLDPAGVDVESDDARSLAERDRDRKPDVPEPDDRDVPAVRHQGAP